MATAPGICKIAENTVMGETSDIYTDGSRSTDRNLNYQHQAPVFYHQQYNQPPPAFNLNYPPPNWYPAYPQGYQEMYRYPVPEQGYSPPYWVAPNGSSVNQQDYTRTERQGSRPNSSTSHRSDSDKRNPGYFGSGRTFEGRKQASYNPTRGRGRGRGSYRTEDRLRSNTEKNSVASVDPSGSNVVNDVNITGGIDTAEVKTASEQGARPKHSTDKPNVEEQVPAYKLRNDEIPVGQESVERKPAGSGSRQNDNVVRQRDNYNNYRENYYGRRSNNNDRSGNYQNRGSSVQSKSSSYHSGRERRKKGQLQEMREDKDATAGLSHQSTDQNINLENTVQKQLHIQSRQFQGRPNFRGKSKPIASMDESQRGVLIEQLTEGSYECMVCCETVRASNAVWGCENCFHVFHLRCIKKWARSPNAIVSGSEKDGWRCPACQNLTFKFPNQYRCFCGKVRDPDYQRNETPHSCGDVCKKSRGTSCKHPCNILCHPGPCPVCNAVITKSCDCGKTKMTVKCGQSASVKCTGVCEKQLNCGKHFCQSLCHSGQCEKCEAVVKQECYCKGGSREVVCGSSESFQESYSCGNPCGKVLDCGNHTCEMTCHEGFCDGCPDLPSRLTHCPCGTALLTELCETPRVSCLDPVPVCGAKCNKRLLCGPEDDHHRCGKSCHTGPCGPCKLKTVIKCRCGAIERKIPCTETVKYTAENPFLCDKRCNKKRSCGRHKCGQNCCVKTEHLCDLICGGRLACGLHKCTEPCHRGNCPPCLMASFDELTCYCGQEVMYPPVPCGTRPPECHRPCTRQHTCDHQVRHNCHSDETCPPCTELVIRRCMGGHTERKNIMCHYTDISCGMPCGKPLPCGQHNCKRACHKGDCIAEGETCKQQCTFKREFCDHPCASPCHADKPCPKVACKATVVVKCPCGNRHGKVMCGKGGQLPNEVGDYQRITMQNLADALQGSLGCSSVDLNKFSAVRGGAEKQLECNEDCAVMERNRRFAMALEIQNPDVSAKLGNPSYTDFLKDFAKQNPHFVATTEKAFSELVQNAKQSKYPHRSHSFPNMNNNQRRLIHELAEFYGCETQSYDYEPKKNVVATAYKDKCWLPSVTLTSLVQRELHPRAPIPIPHVHREETLRQTAQAAKQSTEVFGESSRPSAGADGWNVVGKKTKKSGKSESSSLDNFGAGGKTGPTKAPVVDYFDFSVK